jgi:uncharacterized protein (TIGR02231 family)
MNQLLFRMFWIGLFGIGSCLMPATLMASSVSVESRLTRVTVYPDSAMVTRTARVRVTSGIQQIEFRGMIPDIDENTLRVSGHGSAEVKIHGAFIKRDYLTIAPAERVNTLNQKIQSLIDQLARERSQEQTLQEQRNFLKSVQIYSGQQIPKDLATRMPSVEELEGLLRFIGQQNAQLNSLGEEITLRIRELNEEKAALEKERQELNQPGSRLIRSVVVNLEGIQPGDFTVEVTFLVRGATWYPVYDARADFAASSVELDQFAMVRQNTGEDWVDVALSLSTARPSLSGQLPKISSLILRPEAVVRQKPTKNIFGGKIAGAPQFHLDREVQYEPYYLERSYDLPGEKVASSALSEAESRGTSVVYHLPGNATVKSDGTDQKLPISTQNLTANYFYSAYPRSEPVAFLGTRVINAPDLQLLAGEVNIFLDGDYVGKSRLKAIGPSEDFVLFLGRDENVKVERKLVEKKIEEMLIGKIPAPNKKSIYRYLVSIENLKDQQISVFFYESMPVTESDRIKVKFSEINPEPAEKDWDDRKGVWRWDETIASGQKKEFRYRFEVEHPRDMRIEGMVE